VEAAAEAEAEAADIREHGPVFPTPPMDLPHYHGIGVTAGGKPVAPGTPSDSPKEVTNA